jgi:menaquinone-9 beta-reductase
MTSATDVFVIGGGPAGLAAAIAARVKGFSVVVADGAEPPVDKACGEGLLPETLEPLRQLKVHIPLSEAFAFRGIQFVQAGLRVQADFPSSSGLGVRRLVLHQRMIERARQAGVRLRWNTPVTGISSAGVIVGGETVRARWIIGADGIHSRVRRWIGLGPRSVRSSRFAFRRHYNVAPWSDYVEVHWGREGQAYVTPVSDREACVVLISHNPRARFDSIAKDFPQLAQRLNSAQFVSSERGAVTASQSLRRVYRGNVALVGDASGTLDAITGEGLSLSFHQAIALAEALECDDLRLYQAAHRRITRRPSWMGRALLLLDKHETLRNRILGTFAAHPDLFARIVALHAGRPTSTDFAATSALLGWHLLTA